MKIQSVIFTGMEISYWLSLRSLACCIPFNLWLLYYKLLNFILTHSPTTNRRSFCFSGRVSSSQKMIKYWTKSDNIWLFINVFQQQQTKFLELSLWFASGLIFHKSHFSTILPQIHFAWNSISLFHLLHCFCTILRTYFLYPPNSIFLDHAFFLQWNRRYNTSHPQISRYLCPLSYKRILCVLILLNTLLHLSIE